MSLSYSVFSLGIMALRWGIQPRTNGFKRDLSSSESTGLELSMFFIPGTIVCLPPGRTKTVHLHLNMKPDTKRKQNLYEL